jgi:hypothetical protein
MQQCHTQKEGFSKHWTGSRLSPTKYDATDYYCVVPCISSDLKLKKLLATTTVVVVVTRSSTMVHRSSRQTRPRHELLER